MKNINYETFKDVLLNCIQHKVDYYKLQTSNTKPEDKHKIHLKEFTKKGLSCFDDKRYILSDGIHTLPHGNEKIKLIEELEEINKKYGTNVTDIEIYNVKIRYRI